jgi:two-component system, chemotaxis family, protein-glutamate methylesterase/glutaminase
VAKRTLSLVNEEIQPAGAPAEAIDVTQSEGRGVTQTRRDLVVIGASAGGVDALARVVAGLPADLPAAVCVVLHIAPSSPSALAHILRRAGSLRCRQADDGDRLQPGQILVAPPDRHLVIEDEHVRLTVGPREHGHRPSVDALFRSAAAARGQRVIGVVLSGNRDDGTAGLAAIKAAGGGTIVQDPKEALYAGMPESAVATVAVDAVVPCDRVAGSIAAMVSPEDPVDPPPGDASAVTPPADPMISVCPECGGVLTEERVAGVPQWRCRVGHRYSQASFAEAQAESVEAALWTAIGALSDRATLLRRMSARFESEGQARSARAFERKASDAGEQAELVRRALSSAAGDSLRHAPEDEPGEAPGAASAAG